MPRLWDIGPKGFHKVIAAATSSFTPLYDRAAICTRILLDAVSADDTWVLSVQGKELARFPIYGVGNQQSLGGSAAAYPKANDIFSYVRDAIGEDLIYPIPQGQTLTIASVGGATADITLEYEEHSPGDIVQSLMNHPMGTRLVLPVFLPYPTVTHAAGTNEDDFTAQIAPSFFPQLWGLTELPANWLVRFLAMFIEGVGRNTFSGSADHQSVTDHLAIIRNGMRLFTRDANDGVPAVGPASAAGSANTVYGSVNTPYPAFQLAEYDYCSVFAQPFTLRGGDQFRFLLGTTGDSTGGAAYSKGLLMLLSEVITPQGSVA